jgi:DNA-binding LacI/PurR family transcriptional regulator
MISLKGAKMQKVTIDDVAKAAGVAKSTVSRIINNKPGAKKQTRKKVLEAIDKLEFSPNILARSLKTNLRRQIALAIDDIRNPYYPELAWAAEQVCRQNDYRLLLINHYGNPSEELAVIAESNGMHVDGIILCSIAYPKTITKVINKSSVPVSLIMDDDLGEEMHADTVSLSVNEGMLAMDHLIRIGRTRIAYAGGPKGSHKGKRFDSYVRTLEENFLKIDPTLVFHGDDFSLQTGVNATRYFNQLNQLPDAIYAGNDMIAIGLIKEFEDCGVRVPEDVAIIGIDNIKWSVITKPKISSVSNMPTEMARIATEMLLDRIEHGKDLPYRRVKLEPRLIVRESTVKPL